MTPRSRFRFAFLARLLLVLGLASAFVPARAAEPEPTWVRIGTMPAELFLPAGDRPWPVVVFSHGRAPKAEGRAALKEPILRGHANYWMTKGFAVVAPIRPGYGEGGGPDRESSGARWDAQGQCLGAPRASVAAAAAADAVDATLAWGRDQPWARADRILLVGQSVGGMTSVAEGARNPAGVIGVINFSGGTGGDPENHPGQSCGVADIAALYREAGRTSRIPSLWLYASNDLFWGPEVPKQWYAAFKAGGAQHATFVMTEPVPDPDGHNLLRRGGRLWSDHVNPFVASLSTATPAKAAGPVKGAGSTKAAEPARAAGSPWLPH